MSSILRDNFANLTSLRNGIVMVKFDMNPPRGKQHLPEEANFVIILHKFKIPVKFTINFNAVIDLWLVINVGIHELQVPAFAPA